jgi:hypothetical protein
MCSAFVLIFIFGVVSTFLGSKLPIMSIASISLANSHCNGHQLYLKIFMHCMTDRQLSWKIGAQTILYTCFEFSIYHNYKMVIMYLCSYSLQYSSVIVNTVKPLSIVPG